MFENRTRERIKAEMLEELNESSGLTTLEGGFADQCFGPMAVQYEKICMAMDAILGILNVDETCGGLIDIAAGNFAMERKAGVKAMAAVDFEGESGAYISAGTLFSTAAGLLYELQAAVTLDGEGTGHGILVAQEVGSRYNVAAGAIDRMLVNPVGLESFAADEAKGGVDVEGDEALVGRYYDKLQRPVTSGNPNHYRQWAMEVPGVGDAKVISLVDGPGTVGITLVSEAYGPVEAPIVSAVAAHIEAERPVGISAAPSVKSAEALPIQVTVASKLDTSVTPALVAASLKARLAEYLRSLVEAKYAQPCDPAGEDTGYTLSYNRVATLLMTLPGVVDYTSMTINGGRADVVIGKDQVPTVGEVSVT